MKSGKFHTFSAPLATLLALTAVLAGCGDAGDGPEPAAQGDAPVSVPSPDETVEATTPAADTAAKAAAPDSCDLLTIAEIKKLTGLAVSIRTDTPDRCIWIVEKPTDSHYGGLTIGVEGYATAEKAEEAFKWYVDEPVPGIGDEASIKNDDPASLAIRVGAAKITITEQNPAITREILFELGRSAARNAA
ncbi:hypothetical protein ACFQFC_17360 [Amorphoplanes digitatis]|uniref:DUF3558 domain-containing protein n=1 Tax=Actinoplanes digitatis TaxID=1868 RepID=A0A7W7MTP1_9ACTN|nr:hypothetical protein [Actinoplanes digitatis]MBB4765982.1 hypothetical protein [Actinoplanes digitatis]BFE75946.1 hypothetical protein GCM10020092_092470 [Actinoplanes digitatis]GID97260.1 hypothetical protein Adi01nite_66720 [Actinoplanes digitatis]